MIIDKVRDVEKLKALFESRPMQTDLFTFEHILNNPNLFCFYGEHDGLLKGFIFITQDADEKLYLSGVSVPKNLPDNRDAIIKVCEAFNQDIYADTDLKHAVYMLILAGFKHYEGNIYIRRRTNGEIEQSARLRNDNK